ncbi:MAG: hypothetical protein Q4A44_01555 [Bacteroidales bacterium]|nr:hypothetical protein [Bacteroidales bacterium]
MEEAYMSIYDAVKRHFETTPQEVLDKEWEELAHLNDIGPDVLEYGRVMRPHIEAYVLTQHTYTSDFDFASNVPTTIDTPYVNNYFQAA